ncbi:cellulose synthase operon protein YhjQ [Rheinheimera sediminis]|uniref:cellulose biosynthesis protein BcsQ n=1 Tax=Rheinheimera sp. YQF-1 TaxID=2499626 RepID=UPI000FD94659|nr:cellulose biosynthesis protein BcsQ [Rheinheimera sp. YQF-1]RVT47137.1 cellulose synthase operon protein YhjQ [Rheinheimera sp. YQF-1]
MSVICIASPKGGVGKTTMSANLAFAIQRLGHRVVAIDFDNQNALRLHFGMPLSDSSGYVEELDSSIEWTRLAQDTDSGVRYLPYGRVDKSRMAYYDQWLRSNPTLLAKKLAPFLNQSDTVIIADLPPGPSAALQALSLMDPMIINVLLADSASLSVLPEIESGSFYGEDAKQRTYFLLNQVDMRSQLNRDITQFLNGRLASSLLGIVHRDEAVPEANANQMSVFRYAQSSSVAADIDSIARNIHRLLPKMHVSEYKKYS